MLRTIFCEWLGWHRWTIAKNRKWDGNGEPPMFCSRCYRYKQTSSD